MNMKADDHKFALQLYGKIIRQAFCVLFLRHAVAPAPRFKFNAYLPWNGELNEIRNAILFERTFRRVCLFSFNLLINSPCTHFRMVQL